jgi:glycosyltransferase involved in cell wall biosynthesis
MKISVVIPVFNEEKFVLQTLEDVNKQKKKFNLEIIIIDDFSTDNTLKIIEDNSNLFDKFIKNEKNYGKGKSIILGIKEATGDLILLQDCDLEYDPEEYTKLIEPFTKYNADVVLGSRFKGSGAKRIIYFTNHIANKFLTFLTNLLLNRNFSDIETGYKVINKKKLDLINLEQNRFGIEIELIMKLSRTDSKIYEVGINYNGRTYDEGKKIKFIAGVIAVYLIFYYFFKKQ